MYLLCYRDKPVANLLAVGYDDMAVGGASHGLSAALATCRLLHIQHQLGMCSNHRKTHSHCSCTECTQMMALYGP